MRALILTTLVALFTFQPAYADRAEVPANAPTIKVVDAGKGPKKELRFTAKKGLKRTLTMTMEMGMTMNMGGTPNTQKIPAIKMAMNIVVADVAANGDIRYDFTLLKPEIVADKTTPPAVVEAMKGAVAGMAGLTGYGVVTSRGFTKEADVTVPAGANAQTKTFVDSLKQSIGQLSAPVPEEAVGVGAKWETTMKMAQNGMNLDQTATTELVSLKGSVMTLKISINQSAAPQKITTNGVTVDLKSYQGTGSGETTMDLAKLVPNKAKVTMKSDMQMASGTTKIGMGLDLAMTMAAK